MESVSEPLGAWALIKEKLQYRATNFSFDFIFLQHFITKLSLSLNELHSTPTPTHPPTSYSLSLSLSVGEENVTLLVKYPHKSHDFGQILH